MAVKKKVNVTAEDVEVKEEVVVAEETETVVVDTTAVEEEPKVEVVTTETKSSKKDKACRIKMRTDHTCNIGGEWYYLKAGQCYNVDDNVKRILDEAGLLAPL